MVPPLPQWSAYEIGYHNVAVEVKMLTGFVCPLGDDCEEMLHALNPYLIPHNGQTPWRVIQYLVMVGRFRSDDTRFWDFWSNGALFYTSAQSNWLPLSADKIGLSLSHLVPEILGPTVGQIFHQNVLFNCFKYCISILSLIFDPIDALFDWS